MGVDSKRSGARIGVQDWFRSLREDWDRFWFTPVDPLLACLVRIGLGVVLLYVYGTWGSLAIQAVVADGVIDERAIEALSKPNEYGFAFVDKWTPSLWFHVTQTPAVTWVYGFFLLSIACFTVGLGSRLCNLLVLAFHLSMVHRATAFAYGVDSVLSMLLLYSLLAPIGARYSLDAWIARRRGVPREAKPSLGANLMLRCIQVHLCVIYLGSGLSKLQGESWWDGMAVWDVMMSHELHLLDMRWLAQWGDLPAMVVSTFASAFTIAYEVGFPFLIWNRRLRPLLLASAVALHGGIAVTMGLWSFGATMLVACAAFIPPEWLTEVGHAQRPAAPPQELASDA